MSSILFGSNLLLIYTYTAANVECKNYHSTCMKATTKTESVLSKTHCTRWINGKRKWLQWEIINSMWPKIKEQIRCNREQRVKLIYSKKLFSNFVVIYIFRMLKDVLKLWHFSREKRLFQHLPFRKMIGNFAIAVGNNNQKSKIKAASILLRLLQWHTFKKKFYLKFDKNSNKPRSQWNTLKL